MTADPGPARLEALKRMLEESPADRDLRYFLATEYFRLDRFPEALAELEEYFRTGDDEGVGYRMRGTCLFHLGRREEARACLLSGIEAARRHHHRDLTEEIEQTLSDLFPGS